MEQWPLNLLFYTCLMLGLLTFLSTSVISKSGTLTFLIVLALQLSSLLAGHRGAWCPCLLQRRHLGLRAWVSDRQERSIPDNHLRESAQGEIFWAEFAQIIIFVHFSGD